MMKPQSLVYLKMGSTKRQNEVVRVGVSETIRLVSLQKTAGKLSYFLLDIQKHREKVCEQEESSENLARLYSDLILSAPRL